jgi:predicted AAA+ superfamily ATPase
LRTLDKFYVVDSGFRGARLGKQESEDRGHLLENVVYLELRRCGQSGTPINLAVLMSAL